MVAEVEEHMGAVVLHADVEVFRDGGLTGFQWETRYGHCKWVIAAPAGACVSCWTFVEPFRRQGPGVSVLVVDDAKSLCELAIVHGTGFSNVRKWYQ